MSRVSTVVVGGCVLIWGLFTINSPATAEPSVTRPLTADDAQPSAGPDAVFGVRTRRWELFDVAAGSAAATAAERYQEKPAVHPIVEHVVFISVDGFNPQALAKLGPAAAPALHRMMNEGASTLNARTTVEQTRTLPNHSSMASGRKVATPEGHGVTFNGDNGSTIHASAGGYVASIFDVVHDNGGSTALYATGKTKFDFMDRSWDGTNGAPDVTGPDDGRDKIDSYQVTDSATNLSTLLTRLAAPNPTTFSFVHFADPDTAGHASGFLSPVYLHAVTRLDGYLDQILDAVAADPDLAGRTVVIVTTDHGGADGAVEHADPTAPTNYTVPFLAWGEGVAAGADLYSLNPDRADPGTSQPPYTAPVPPIRTGEAANLIAELLGYGPVLGATFNVDQSLDVALPVPWQPPSPALTR
ncbi:MAG TPA: alkaline phosphatase family protein [Jiangellaceae bacterium]